MERASHYTRVSESTLYYIMQRDNGSSPQPMKREQKLVVDDFDRDVMRRTIRAMLFSRQQVPNVTLLKEEQQKRIGFSGGRETFRKLLHETGSRWKKTQTNRSLLMERTDIVAARVQFLRKMHKMRADGRTIVYTDETFVHTSHCVHRSWQSESVALKVPFGKGERFIVVHAGTDNGFIEGASLVFKAKTSQGDYHNEMNGENFMRWLNERIKIKSS